MHLEAMHLEAMHLEAMHLEAMHLEAMHLEAMHLEAMHLEVANCSDQRLWRLTSPEMTGLFCSGLQNSSCIIEALEFTDEPVSDCKSMHCL